MNAPKGFIIVGQAQDGISNDDWGAPISEFPALMDMHDEADDFGVAFPLKKLSIHLIAEGFISKPLAREASDDFQTFLKVLLHGDFYVESEFWTKDMPGESSFYLTAYLRKSQLKRARSLLDASLQFLNAWRSQLQSADSKRKRVVAIEPTLPKISTRPDLPKIEGFKTVYLPAQQWEDELFQQIMEQVTACSSTSFSRLNFLVHQGNIFYLDTSWWHPIRGSPEKVAHRLELLGISFTSVRVVKSSRGSIPYFGRRRAEEFGLGWQEATIELDACSPQANAAMAIARANLAKEPHL